MAVVEQRGDLVKYWRQGNIIGVTTNGFVKKNGAAVMGAGIAKTVRDALPGIDVALGQSLTAHGNIPFYFEEQRVFTFPVKHHWRENADPELIRLSFATILNNAKFDIHVPRPGCGNGKLDWNDVKPLLVEIYEDYWDRMQDQAVDVYVWSF